MKQLSGTMKSLYSGGVFDFLNPENSTYGIEDIAHALSNICRFGGHVRYHYSVAQHCVLASHYTKKLEFSYDILMHDAAEAFLGDIPTPLKALLPDYKVIEERVERDICKRYMIQYPFHPEVKAIDRVMLCAEQKALVVNQEDWGFSEEEHKASRRIRIDPWTFPQAKNAFLMRFWELRNAMEKVA